MPAFNGRDEHWPCSTSDVITFIQNWHHLYSSFAGGKDLSSNTQIRVIGSMVPEIHTKMLRNLSENSAAKFPATTLSYSMVKSARLDDALSEIFELEADAVESQSLLQKRWEKEKNERRVPENWKVVKRGAGKKGMPFWVDRSLFGPFPGWKSLKYPKMCFRQNVPGDNLRSIWVPDFLLSQF